MAQHEIAHLHGALYCANPQVLVGLPLTLLAIFGHKYIIVAIFITRKYTHMEKNTYLVLKDAAIRIENFILFFNNYIMQQNNFASSQHSQYFNLPNAYYIFVQLVIFSI